MTIAYQTTFSDPIPGGPCPSCGHFAMLLMHTGTFDPQGDRRIMHSRPDGDFQVCHVPMSHGYLLILPTGRWTYREGDLCG